MNMTELEQKNTELHAEIIRLKEEAIDHLRSSQKYIDSTINANNRVLILNKTVTTLYNIIKIVAKTEREKAKEFHKIEKHKLAESVEEFANILQEQTKEAINKMAIALKETGINIDTSIDFSDWE